MADQWLALNEAELPESRVEYLTRRFYEWELRGRGWLLLSHPVELEPPFRPLYFDSERCFEARDDGRKPTFLSNLAERLLGANSVKQQPEQTPSFYPDEGYFEPEPLFCRYYNDEFGELQLILPKDARITKQLSEQLLVNLAGYNNRSPASFEVIGTNDSIRIQLAATERNLPHVRQQLEAHLPGAGFVEEMNFLLKTWRAGGREKAIVDFGLSREFMLPLRLFSGFETDPLVAVIGALSNLGEGEVGILQVLFQPVQFPWAEEIRDSVQTFDGSHFFINAPEMLPLAKEKTSRPLYAAIIRVAACGYSAHRAGEIARNLGSSLRQLSNPAGNELIPLSNDEYDLDDHERSLLNRQSCRLGMILSSEELVSLVHPPTALVQTEKLVRDAQKTKQAPQLALGHSLVLGLNEHNSERREVSLSEGQRTKHIHLIGSSGSGKSTLLLNMIRQDMERGVGLALFDPHGDLVDDVLAHVPDNRIKDVVLFDPSDAEFPIGFNPLQANSEAEKTLLASDLVATFRRFSTSWGDVMDAVLANAVLAVLESSKGGTLFDLKRLLVEKEFRSEFLKTVNDDAVRYFWQHEYPALARRSQSSILVRLDTFLRQKLVRNVVCQKKSRLNFREIMDNRKILLARLSQGSIGEENSYLLGTLLVSKLYQIALSRQDTEKEKRSFFGIYLDEFHHFIAPSLANILSGVRKYNIGLALAHQEFRQLQSRDSEVAQSVLSNCYTRICFRLGDADAERFASGFSFFDKQHLQSLGVGEAIARVERSEYDFNLRTLPAPVVSGHIAARRKQEIIERTRQEYGAHQREQQGQPQMPSSASAATEKEFDKELQISAKTPALVPQHSCENLRQVHLKPAGAREIRFATNTEKILHFLQQAEYLSQPQIIGLTKLQASNASTALRKLVDSGQIKALEERRPKVYYIGRTCNPTLHNLLIRDLFVKICASEFAIETVKFNASLPGLNPDLKIEFAAEDGAPLLAYFELDRGTEGVQELARKAERYRELGAGARVGFIFERESDMNLARRTIASGASLLFAVLGDFASLREASFYVSSGVNNGNTAGEKQAFFDS